MKKIGGILILLGLVVVWIPFLGHFYLQYKQQSLYRDYYQHVIKMEKQKEVVGQENLEGEEGQVSEENQEEKTENVMVSDGEVIGKITIKKAGIDLILLEGAGDKELKIGAGHMRDTAYPGEVGNCVVAGHRNYTFGSMFNRLDEVEIGDEVNIEFEGSDYTYKVEEIEIVKPDEVSVLKQSEIEKELTLITCHPVYTGTHRLIIRGKLEE